MRVLAIVVGRIVVFCRKNAGMIVQKLQAVALFEQVAVAVIDKRNVILCRSSASCVVGKGIAVVGGQLSAVCPRCSLATVRGRIADDVIDNPPFVVSGVDWQVFPIIPQTEDFSSSVNLFPTTRLSRGFQITKNHPAELAGWEISHFLFSSITA